MKVKIDEKHRLQIPKCIWDACKKDNEEPEIRLVDPSKIEIDFSPALSKLHYVQHLHVVRDNIEPKQQCKGIAKEFGCIIQLVDANEREIEFAAVCDADTAAELKDLYGR